MEDTGVIVGEPERVPNRLQRPGTALPVSGRERVSAKRRPATRQRQNLRLMEEVRRLQQVRRVSTDRYASEPLPLEAPSRGRMLEA